MKEIYFAKKNKTLSRFLPVKFPGISKLMIFVLMIPVFWSCEFLDYNESAQYEKDKIFYYMDRTKQVLSNIYGYLPTDYSSVGGAMRSSATDDAVDVWDISDIQKFGDGSWNAVVTLDNVWNNMYAAIRTANVFLAEAPGLTFSETVYNVGYADAMKAYKLYPYEARFLRAFYYAELIKRYGDVPLDTTVINQEEANTIKPAAYDDIVKFIVRECDSAASKLPVTFSTFISQETGRATKGAAMALKARTLLYAASPLHNPGNDQAKWILAANAAKNLIDQLNATYTPLPVYGDVVNKLTSKELIFERRQASARSFEEANTAIGFIGGNTGTCPTQNLVDAYEMKATGLGINEPGSGYDSANPYSTSGAAARDPRLAMTILYNGSIWKSPLTVETWYGGLNAAPKNNATKTGYYLKKHLIESLSLNPVNPGTAIHYWILFRYAEVLLNYAEAMNEAYGPDATGLAPLDMTARAAVNFVRNRQGVVMPLFPAGMAQSAFREKLMNERRVELAFEDHRFWDIRRWKIGNDTRVIRGVDLTKNGTVITYIPKVVETRIWDDKMYLYPIPQTELFINHNLVQNPGW